jgi:hypothetical protein
LEFSNWDLWVVCKLEFIEKFKEVFFARENFLSKMIYKKFGFVFHLILVLK